MNRHKAGKFILIFVAIGLIVFFNAQGWLQSPKSIVYRVFSPFQKISSALGRQAADFFGIFFRVKFLTEQNQKLREENLRLLAEINRLSLLDKENELLKKELNLKKESGLDFVLADIVGSDIRNYSHLIFVNKGSVDGVKTGQAAVLADRIFVGLVKEVYDKSSKIETIFNFSARFNVITEKSRVAGVVIAKNSGVFMDLIDPQKEVIVGEKVLTSGTGDVFPKGLLVGEINEIINRDNQIFKQAQIAIPYNIKEIERVLIIK